MLQLLLDVPPLPELPPLPEPSSLLQPARAAKKPSPIKADSFPK
jgi:hypothetical protein